jgi:hypothetical protein
MSTTTSPDQYIRKCSIVELAAMAEALVNLTKFKRRITPQKETVGGPIDVAIITRGGWFRLDQA